MVKDNAKKLLKGLEKLEYRVMIQQVLPLLMMRAHQYLNQGSYCRIKKSCYSEGTDMWELVYMGNTWCTKS